MLKMTLANRNKTTHSLPLPSGHSVTFSGTAILGVLNVTPDSFSDGGRYGDPARAVQRAMEMRDEGAQVIDVGGESSRPGSAPVSIETEIARVLPVIEGIRTNSDIPISIDTCKAAVAQAALGAGADIVNDISALRFDPDMANLLASNKVPVILMHMLGTPATMQDAPEYDDCVNEIADFFAERLEFCEGCGIERNRIILDPGIGFGKRLNDNLSILARLSELRRFGCPLMVGTSRKSFIGLLDPNGKQADQRLGGSVASMLTAVANGADLVRVHDVAQTAQALKVYHAVKEAL